MKVVLGSGTMGLSIAESFIMGGYETIVYDPFEKSLEKAKNKMPEDLKFLKSHDLFKESVDDLIKLVSFTSDLKEAVKEADFILEAIPENLNLKLETFAELEKFAPQDCFIGSNTSSLPFSKLIAGLSPKRQAKFLMCHWYNPGNIMPLVELSAYGNMSDKDLNYIQNMFEKMGKVTILAKKEVPGMVANRIQQGIAREVFWLMANEVASPEDIDKALSFGPAFRYATSGQLLIADMGGLDIWCTVGDNLLSVMDNSKEANPLLRQKVKEGKLGIKSGEGFFKYPEEEKKKIQENYLDKLAKQLKISKTYLQDKE